MTTSETGAAAARTDAVPQLKDSPRRWILMALLVASMIFCYAHRGALSVATPYMIEDLGISKARMGILLSAFFWVYSFLQMPAGWMVDRFGVRRAYAFGYAFWSLASILTGFAKSLPMLIGLRVWLGIGQAVAFPAAARAVANWFQDRERGMATGSYLVGVRLGTALISWVGGWFLARYDWKLFFIVTGAVPLLWLFPWTAFLRRWEDAGAPSSGIAAKKQASFDDCGLVADDFAVRTRPGFAEHLDADPGPVRQKHGRHDLRDSEFRREPRRDHRSGADGIHRACDRLVRAGAGNHWSRVSRWNPRLLAAD